MTISRREILAGGASVAGTLAFGSPTQTVPGSLPDPAASGIDHIVVVCMENRSFDHLLGWLPGANGRQDGLSYPDSAGVLHSTHHLATTQGCQWADPDHSYDGGRTEYRGGTCDGWLLANPDVFPIGYYREEDLGFLGKAALEWTVCDNFFASTMGPTFPNRLYLWGAQTDRTTNTFSFTSIPTIFDRLRSLGISRRYYYSDVPFAALWGLRYYGISKSLDAFLSDAASGNLPAVSYVEPALFLESIDGLSNDYHPHGDIRNGEAFMNQVYRAVTTSPAWPRTVLVFTFDEWGGFFDHVPPSTAPDTNPSVTGLRGFRVPALVVSPYAPRRTVAHGVYDHGSVLKLIEWRHGLPSLSPRDAAANNLAEVLDFAAPPNYAAPQWTVPFAVVPPCGLQSAPGAAPPSADWVRLYDLARSSGWELKSSPSPRLRDMVSR